MTVNLPAEVVETDHRLDMAASKTREALAKHRWHWTLDETNPDRVSIRNYADAVGRHETVVRRHANGYAEWILRGPDPARSLNESIQRGNGHALPEDPLVVNGVRAVNEVHAEALRRMHEEQAKAAPVNIGQRVTELVDAHRRGIQLRDPNRLPRLGELIRDAEHLAQQLIGVLSRNYDPASVSGEEAWPGTLLADLHLATLKSDVRQLLRMLGELAALRHPPVGSAVLPTVRPASPPPPGPRPVPGRAAADPDPAAASESHTRDSQDREAGTELGAGSTVTAVSAAAAGSQAVGGRLAGASVHDPACPAWCCS